VIAHETAHQWWGDLLSWDSYRDQWLVEALANYSALMLLESENRDSFQKVMDYYRANLLQENVDGLRLMQAGPVTLGSRLSSSHFPAGYDAISYGRGTWLFHMLRYMLRDAERKHDSRNVATAEDSRNEPFVRGLRRLRDEYAGQAVSTADVLRAFEQELPVSLRYEGHASLQWFYDSWISGTAIPRLELEGIKYTGKGASTVVSGTVLQKDAPADLVTVVPIYAASGAHPVLIGQVFADGPETTFHITAPAGTSKVVVDPYATVLSRK
jgi:aminopeptidase N